MKLAIISHKVCWKSPDAQSGYVTDGGFPLQVAAISELFSETTAVVPCIGEGPMEGKSPVFGKALSVRPLSVPKSTGLMRKLLFPFWFLTNGLVVWKEIKRADAVHAPIPGDVGTIGIWVALILKKPLFVRHCGNWLVQKTIAERFWKWTMEKYAGGRNVMLATGGAAGKPSTKNPNIQWIFSTSLTNNQLAEGLPRSYPAEGHIRLMTACRIEPKKGVDIVIESMPLISEKFPNAQLDIVGDGSLIRDMKAKVASLGLDEKVTFHGKVEQSKVLQLMKDAHIFCFPTSASEGFPKVVLEALSCGLPVITTKVSVLPTLIGNKCGHIMDSATAELLAAAVDQLCADRERYSEFSNSAVRAAQKYSLENWRDFIGNTLTGAWGVSSLTTRTNCSGRIAK